MDNFSFFDYILGIATGAPWGVVVSIIVMLLVGKKDREQNSRNGGACNCKSGDRNEAGRDVGGK